MKKAIISLATALLASFAVSAQDLAEATELYNNAAAALNGGDKVTAMASFQKALTMAQALGEDGAELLANCKGIIPSLSLSLAKDCIKASDFDNALVKLADAAKIATDLGDAATAKEAEDLVPQVLLSQGGNLLKAQKYTEAAASFKKACELQPANGMAALRLGMALAGAGDTDGAVAAYETAAANGQEKNANKQLSGLFLKKAAASLKAKNYAEAIEAATKSNTYVESAQAYQIAGQACQISKKNKEAIANFEKYLELAPTAKNAGMIAYTVGALYQGAGDKAKAKEFYLKASTDPQYGAEAKKLAASL